MVVVKFNKPWLYYHDRDGDVKTSFPRGLVVEVEDEVAAAAIADAAAEAVRPLSVHVARRVQTNRRILDLVNAGVDPAEAIEIAYGEELAESAAAKSGAAADADAAADAAPKKTAGKKAVK